jgi:Zinc knuckle
VRANITEDDLVTQGVQALPAIYNSTVAGLYERLPNAVTFAVLRRAVGNHYSIAMKGKSGNKTKDIEGGFAAMETQGAGNDKDNLKKLIKDTINSTIREYQEKTNTGSGNQFKSEEQKLQQMNKIGNKANQGFMSMGNTGNAKFGLTPEAVMAMLEASQGRDPNQGENTNMLCYNCGQYGHRSDGCKYARNADLVAKIFQAQGRKPCKHCGKFGHAHQACWSLPQNAHMRPIFQRGQVLAQ